MNKTDIPAGMDLSKALALFRNLPLMDSETFPQTTGDIYSSVDESSQEGKVHSFTNTYQFYRKTDSGDYIAINIVEKHEMGPTAEGGFSHRVFDVKRSLSRVDKLPADARKSGVLSKLLQYVLDHREPLLKSEAGAIAKQLNYGSNGRLRESDYSQPRISFLVDDADQIEKVQVHGLSALLNKKQVATSKLENPDQVLEFSVDNNGKVSVSVKAP